MILVDTGPLIALFDPKDALHECCKSVLKTIREPLYTTIPVLTEAFHIISAGELRSGSAKRLYPQRRLVHLVHGLYPGAAWI